MTNSPKKFRRGLTALAMAPLINLEKKECQKRLDERLKRTSEKQRRLSK